jgi:hypothetical protein
MSNAPSQAPAPARPSNISVGQSRARRDQLICIATAVILMALIFALQPFLTSSRAALIREPEGSWKGMTIAFPRLTLGGFRGLLATALWIKAEDDKNEHRWLQLETDYNYIGTLEPYFVTVYSFNAWNQAYNLSAQWHTDDTKYKWVLDGLTHLYEGELYNPNHPDLIIEEAHMYLLKLGGAYERIYYRRHWRYDIAHLYAAPPPNGPVSKTGDTLLEVKNFVLRPQFNTKMLGNGHGIEITGLPDPKDPTKTSKDPIPFPYGVSPYYFAHQEYQRCLDQDPRRPSTIGIQVVQAYPAMAERLWCRDDLYYSGETMREMFLSKDPETDQYSPTDKPPLKAEFTDHVLELRDCFRNVQMIAPKAINDFKLYIELRKSVGAYAARDAEGTHRKHILETQAMQQIGLAESELFEGLVQYTLDNVDDKGENWKDEPKVTISPAADQHFRKCIDLYSNALVAMDQYSQLTFPDLRPGIPNPDRGDFQQYVKTVHDRMDGARGLLTMEPGKKPDFMFLVGTTVEK